MLASLTLSGETDKLTPIIRLSRRDRRKVRTRGWCLGVVCKRGGEVQY